MCVTFDTLLIKKDMLQTRLQKKMKCLFTKTTDQIEHAWSACHFCKGIINKNAEAIIEFKAEPCCIYMNRIIEAIAVKVDDKKDVD